MARARNEELLALLKVEEDRAIALLAAAAALAEANRLKAAALALTEEAAQSMSANLNKTRAEIIEAERQLEIEDEKARRLAAALRDLSLSEDLSCIGSLSPMDSPVCSRGKGLKQPKMDDFDNDSGSENSQYPTNSMKSVMSPISDTVPPSIPFKKLFPTRSGSLPPNSVIVPIVHPLLIRSPTRQYPVVDKIPINKPPLGRGQRPEEPRKLTAMENEAKIVAERIRSKRDAIRNAVDGSLASREVSPIQSPVPFSSSGSVSSLEHGEATNQDEDDDLSLGPFKAASESLVSPWPRGSSLLVI